MTLLANANQVTKHLRPGYLIPRQGHPNDPWFASPINNTNQIPHRPCEILVNRDEKGRATGRVLFDEGNMTADLADSTSGYYEFEVGANSI